MTQNEQDRIDAERYRKLRLWMTLNAEPTWNEVCRLAAVGCYMGTDDFDHYLDDMIDHRPVPQVGEAVVVYEKGGLKIYDDDDTQ